MRKAKQDRVSSLGLASLNNSGGLWGVRACPVWYLNQDWVTAGGVIGWCVKVTQGNVLHLRGMLPS